MSNSILASVNSAFQIQGSEATKSLENIDLSDKTFSNILNNKLTEEDTQNILKDDNIFDKLGVPAGLNIEGFDYNSELQNSTEKINIINTDSNIQQNENFDMQSLIYDAQDALSSLISDKSKNNMGINSETANATTKAVKNFWKNQASNFYNIMNKESVNNISELIAKL